MNVNYFKQFWKSSLMVIMLCFGLTSWGQDLIYKLDLSAQNSAFGTSNTYGAKSGTVNGVTWYANAASCQSTSAVWLGANNAGNRTSLCLLSTGVNNRGTAIASALETTISTVGYYAIVAEHPINNVGEIKVKAGATGGTAPSTLWCLYTTDGGSTYTILDSKSNPGTTEQTFTPESTIVNAQYAFVFYSSAAGTYRTPYFEFYEGETTPTYTLTYTAGENGSISGTSPQTVQENQSGTAVTAVANTGYHFTNWSDDSTDNPRTDSNVTANISVTANFDINTYTVTYNGNTADGDAPVDNNLYDHGSTVTVLGQGDLVRDGYTFMGWTTEVDNIATLITDNTFTITSDVTLYAFWEDASKLDQTITFDELADVTYGDTDFVLTATSDSGLAITYTSSNENVAIVTGNIVTIVGVGTTVITATQLGDDEYMAATPVEQTFSVNAKNLTISGVTVADKPYDGTTTATINISGATLDGVVVGDDIAFATGTGEFVSADAGSDIAVTLTSDFTLTGTATGNYTLTQPALTGNILKAEQTVTLSDLNAYLGDEAITLPTVTDQGIAIEYISDNESVATVEGNVLTIVGLGTTEVFAGNNGSDNYEEFTGGFEITVTEAPLEPVTIAGWDFNSISGYGASPLIASVINENSEVGGLTRGSGVTTSGSAATRGWGGNGWNVSNQTTAISNNKYVTFTVKAIDGYTLSLSSIDPFEYRRSSTGATQGMLQYSLNGTDFTDIQALTYSSSSSSGGVLEVIDLSSVSELQNVPSTTTVTFRIVNWGHQIVQELGTYMM